MDVKRQLEISKLNLMLSVLHPVKDKHNFEYRYFDMIVRALMLEDKYQAEMTAANKEILRYLDLPTLDTLEPIVELFTELYDPNTSKVRFAIETMDSIECIRLLLKDTPSLLIPPH